MKKKQPWMRIGARVLGFNRPGTITKMDENSIDGIDYVYYIYIRLDFQKHSTPYHPNDVAELQESEVAMPENKKALIEAGSMVRLLKGTRFNSHTFKRGDIVSVQSVGIKRIGDYMFEQAIVYVPLRANHYPIPVSMLELVQESEVQP